LFLLIQASVAISFSSGQKLDKKKVIDFMGRFGELRSIREVEQVSRYLSRLKLAKWLYRIGIVEQHLLLLRN
jgi:hypothetical protein